MTRPFFYSALVLAFCLSLATHSDAWRHLRVSWWMWRSVKKCRQNLKIIGEFRKIHEVEISVMAGDESIILSYHDVLLRRSDVKTLENGVWLNDIVISFYFDYVEREKCKNKSKKIVFCGPEITQLLKMVEVDDYAAILDGRIDENTDFAFFSVNDNENRENPGGAHWSLLVYSKPEASCFHLDSAAGNNSKTAQNFAHKILKFLHKMPNFVDFSCPQQENSYDCGIFVLCNAEAILQDLQNGKKVAECDLKGVKEEAKQKRSKIVKLIENLSQSR